MSKRGAAIVVTKWALIVFGIAIDISDISKGLWEKYLYLWMELATFQELLGQKMDSRSIDCTAFLSQIRSIPKLPLLLLGCDKLYPGKSTLEEIFA